MDATSAIDVVRQAMVLVLVVAAPVLGVGLLVALVVGVLQSLTQVQDQTLSFVPKIVAMLGAVAVFGPWMIARIVDFGRVMFGTLP